jgi:hypothetical protein
LPNLSEYQMRSLGQAAAKYAKQFFKNPENIKRFEEWFLKTHGYPYKKQIPFLDEISTEK